MISLPPFTLFFHAISASTEYNFALLDTSASGDLQDALTRLPTPFTERQRKPCVQFIEEVFPQLTPLLRSAGWTEEARSRMMLCTPETYQYVPDMPGLAIITLTQESSLEEIREGLDTNALGFDPHAEAATIQQAEAFREDLVLSQAFTARLDGQSVAAGMFTSIHDGLTELVGITTLEPFRRRGIAAALTAYITQAAFREGAAQVFLTAEDENAGRVYERVGFRPCATLAAYVL